MRCSAMKGPIAAGNPVAMVIGVLVSPEPARLGSDFTRAVPPLVVMSSRRWPTTPDSAARSSPPRSMGANHRPLMMPPPKADCRAASSPGPTMAMPCHHGLLTRGCGTIGMVRFGSYCQNVEPGWRRATMAVTRSTSSGRPGRYEPRRTCEPGCSSKRLAVAVVTAASSSSAPSGSPGRGGTRVTASGSFPVTALA